MEHEAHLGIGAWSLGFPVVEEVDCFGLMSQQTSPLVVRRKVLALYGLSGLLSLGYQVVWFRVFADRYGATTFTFGLVVLCFIGGLGLGAWNGRRFGDWLAGRTGVRSPLRLYGAMECLVAAALLLTFLFQFVSLPPSGGEPYSFPHEIDGGLEVWRMKAGWKLVMGAAAVIVLTVPCFFMGTTFPLLCHAFAKEARFPSELYAANTLGACLGVIACEFFLIAHWGQQWTLVLLVVLNAGLGMLFLVGKAGHGSADTLVRASEAGRYASDLSAGRRPEVSELTFAATGDADEGQRPEVSGLAVASTGEGRKEESDPRPIMGVTTALALAGLSGVATGALEADLFQQIRFSGYVLSAGMSFVSFWAILAIFLGSLTARAVRLNLTWIRLAALLAPAAYVAAILFRYELRDGIARRFLPYALETAPVRTPHYLDAGLTPLFLFAGVFVFPAFYLLSLILPHVCNQLQAGGHRLGRAYAINTFAFCAGLVGFSFLAPRVDIFYAFKLFLVFFVLAAGTIAALGGDESRFHRKLAFGAAAVLIAVAFGPRGFDERFFHPNTATSITGVRALRSNGASTTYVVRDSNYPGERLYFDGYSMSGTARGDQQYMRLMAHFPLLAQPNPTAALQIGFGVGSTASSIALHDSIVRFDIVDLNHQILATAEEFAANNRNVLNDPRVRLFHDDGRNFLRLTEDRYDLITSEPPPPIFEGVFRLYSKEYYELVLERLTSSGMMTQWLPMNQLSQEAGDWITRSFVQTFPHSLAFVGYAEHVILVGSPQPVSLAMLERRMAASPKIAGELARFGMPTPAHALARVLADDASLKQDFGAGPVIRDARNRFAHLIQRPDQPKLNFRPAQMVERMGSLRSRDDLIAIWSNQAALAQVAPDYPFWLVRLVQE